VATGAKAPGKVGVGDFGAGPGKRYIPLVFTAGVGLGAGFYSASTVIIRSTRQGNGFSGISLAALFERQGGGGGNLPNWSNVD